MIIDAFAHALDGSYLDKLADSGGTWTQKKIEIEQKRAASQGYPQMLDMKLRLTQLDKYGIDKQVVAPTNFWDIDRFPGGTTGRLKITQALNDNLAKIMTDSKGRLPAIGSMTLLEFGIEHRREMERAIKTLGLKGICIQSNANGKGPDTFEEFWKTAVELDIPVYIHPQDPVARTDRTYEAEWDLIHNFGWPYETVLILSRLVFSGMMERYPTLKIVSHHLGGGMVPFYMGRINETYARERQKDLFGQTLPKPLIEYYSLFYYDTAVGGSAAAVKCAYEVFGSKRMIFATDFPFGPNGGLGRLEKYPDVVRSLGLSNSENRAIFEGNIRKALKL